MPNGTCTIDGCDKPQFARQWCGPHYKRWYRHGDPHVKVRRRCPDGATPDERLRYIGWTERVAVTDLGACWEFAGTIRPDGYGWMYSGTKPDAAHRVAYRAWVGEIPDGLLLRHRCDNPPCINPSHLLTGTDADNSNDKVSRDRAGKKLNNAQRAELIAKFTGTWHGEAAALGREYGITTATVCNILRRAREAPGGHLIPRGRGSHVRGPRVPNPAQHPAAGDTARSAKP